VLRLEGEAFCFGRTRFLDHPPESIEPTAKVYVEVHLGTLGRPGAKVLAQIDTGAAWSVLSPETAREAQVVAEAGQPALLRTALGLKRGFLVEIPFVLLAQEGDSLEADGTFFIPSDWPADLNFLGYTGLLSKIRFAVDPEANHFYFGRSARRL
jgi:hypothetical protein